MCVDNFASPNSFATRAAAFVSWRRTGNSCSETYPPVLRIEAIEA